MIFPFPLGARIHHNAGLSSAPLGARFQHIARLMPLLWFATSLGSCTPPHPSELAHQNASAEQEAKEHPAPLVAGSRISLWLPNDVARFSRLYAFRRQDPLLLVIVNEMSASSKAQSDQLVGGIIDGSDRFGAPRESSRNGQRQILMDGQISGTPALSLILAEGAAVANLIVTYSPASQADAEKIVASAQLNPSAVLDPLATHALGLAPAGKLKVSSSMQQPILLRDEEASLPNPKTSPVAYISMVLHGQGSDVSEETLGAIFASSTTELGADASSVEATKVSIAGVEATEVTLSGEKEGAPLSIYGYVLNEGDTAITAVGYVAQSRAAEEMPSIVQTLRSLRLNDYSKFAPHAAPAR